MWYDKLSMKPILIGLSPNTETDDVRLARRELLHPAGWTTGSIPATQLHGLPTAWTGSGRQALYLLLKALGVGSGDEVIIQAFTCLAVPAPVTWLGATPVYADIDPATYNLTPETVAARISPRTKAIVVQHTFGIPARIKELRALATQHHLILIEDCAHALGATVDTQPVGTFGDAAIFSFGRDKVISSVFGGAVVSRDHALIEKIQADIATLPLPPKRWIKQQLMHPVIMSFVKRWYFTGGIGKAVLVVSQRLGLLGKAVTADERRGGTPTHVTHRPVPALFCLFEHQFTKLDRYTARRRQIVQRYHNAFDGPAGLLRFPVRVADPARVRRQALQHGMMLGDWYDAPIVPAAADEKQFGYQHSLCPTAEDAAAHVINLPTYPTMTDEQVEKVIMFMKPYVNS